MKIIPIPVLQDNYAYLLVDNAQAIVVDPSEASPIERVAEKLNLRLMAVVNTHHHWDHVGGNTQLADRFKCPVFVPEGDTDRIRGATEILREGPISLLGLSFSIWKIPGHTHHHIALIGGGAVFTGDTLFLMGCGRLFEGTADQMWASLLRLTTLAPDTKIYCGHEYTQANARFALSLDPADSAVTQRVEKIRALREKGLPTVPGTLGEELETNPFLRVRDEKFRKTLFPHAYSETEAFAQLRLKKDRFT